MKRETVEFRELDKIINGIAQELSLMYKVEPELVLDLIGTFSEYMSHYISSVYIVNLN